MSSRCLAVDIRRLMMAVDIRRAVVPRVQICVVGVRDTPSGTGIRGSGAGVIAGPARVIGSHRMRSVAAATARMSATAGMTTAACMPAAALMTSERRKRQTTDARGYDYRSQFMYPAHRADPL